MICPIEVIVYKDVIEKASSMLFVDNLIFVIGRLLLAFPIYIMFLSVYHCFVGPSQKILKFTPGVI